MMNPAIHHFSTWILVSHNHIITNEVFIQRAYCANWLGVAMLPDFIPLPSGHKAYLNLIPCFAELLLDVQIIPITIRTIKHLTFHLQNKAILGNKRLLCTKNMHQHDY